MSIILILPHTKRDLQEIITWCNDNSIQLEDEMYQASSDGCYVCDKKGNPNRKTSKVILKNSNLQLEKESDFTKEELDELKAKGTIRYTETKTFTPTKTGFREIDELDKFIKDNDLKVDGSKLEEIKSSFVTNLQFNFIPLPVTFEHEVESYSYVDDFEDHCPVEFKIHKDSEVQQEDLDKRFTEKHYDFGNMISTGFRINRKFCTIAVLKHGTTITTTLLNKLAQELLK